MKRSTSVFFLILAVTNIVMAVIPSCAGVVGAYKTASATDMVINNKQVGPELDKMIAQEAPLAKVEAFTAAAVNAFSCLLLVAGSIGIFMSQGWGRWVAVAGALIMIVGLFAHDIYQFFFYRPALMAVIDRLAAPVNAAPLNQVERDAQNLAVSAVKWGTTMYTMAWSCINPLIMLYFLIAGLCLGIFQGFRDGTEIGTGGSNASSRGGDMDDEEDEDRPKKKKKRQDDDDVDDERPSKSKKRDRGEYEDDDAPRKSKSKKRDRDEDRD
jgi:cytochrome c biogenesis protein CcdA